MIQNPYIVNNYIHLLNQCSKLASLCWPLADIQIEGLTNSATK